jgi:hypothetical protein
MDRDSDRTSFVYPTYILATPEQVWHGLIEPELTVRW